MLGDNRELWNWVLQTRENFEELKQKTNRFDIDYDRCVAKQYLSYWGDNQMQLKIINKQAVRGDKIKRNAEKC